MEKELKRALENIKYEMPSNLPQNIWNGILSHNRRIGRIKLWTSSLLGLFSLIGLVPAWKTLFSDLNQSGFYDYFSLIFSSGNSISSFWRELALSMAESLPTASIILSLSVVLVLFMSFKYITKQIIRNQLLISI